MATASRRAAPASDGAAPTQADLLHLARRRFIAGARLDIQGLAEEIGVSRATAYREWTFARAWLTTSLADHSEKP